MADVVMDAVVGSLVENLISLLQREFSLIKGVEKDVEKLSRTLSTIQAVLQDAETNQSKNKSITVWLRDLKDAVYDAEDVLEEWSIEEAQRLRDPEFTNNMGCTSQVSLSVSSCFSFSHVIFRRKIATKLKELISTFDEISAQKNKFHLNVVAMPYSEPLFDKKRETTSKITEPWIYGRDGDKKNVIDMLLNNVDCPAQLSIFAIIGFGGVGKTTLAQSVYNDERVVRCFEVRIWVCVSEPFDIERVLKAMFEALEKKCCDLKTLESIQSEVGERLRGKKYLLVLDDVWNENQDEWNKLKGFVDGGANGSSIILTTRLERVASLTGALSTYRLGVLSDDDCWSLLKDRAFCDTCEEGHTNLVKIGMEIVKKCKGLPLAAKSLGSLLGSKIDEKHWELVRDSEIWNFEEGGENTILAALRLSYNHLPSHLKQCFAYCSLYPKDHVIKKNKLICLWIANGFFQSQGRMNLEEIGEDAFRELLWLSFFQDTTEDGYGNIKTCKMHDLMHDLACSVAVNECLIKNVNEKKDVPKTVRHLSVSCASPVSPIVLHTLIRSSSSLRTLFFFHSFHYDELNMTHFDSFNFPTTLRVLDLSPKVRYILPSSILNILLPSIRYLKHLRYLDISFTCLVSFPEFIHELRNLQMLDLSHSRINTVPLSIGKMKHLRYLNLSHTQITLLPESIHSLRNLQRLDLSYNKIKTLPLSIGKLESLRYLNLSRTCITSLLESIQGLKNLHALDLGRNIGIASLPESMSDLRNLQSLILSNCWNFQVLPENIGNMSSLRHLHLEGCYELSKMPVGIGKLTCLQTLKYFVIGVTDGDNRCASIKELRELNQLREELWIEQLENVRNSEDAKEANLKSKPYLTDLHLSWTDDGNGNDDPLQESNSKEVLEVLGLPPNLQVLSIEGYRGATCFPLGYFRALQLKYLEIRNCHKLKSLPAEIGNLTELTSLRIMFCKELVFSNEDFQHFTSVQSLELRGLPKLTALPEGIQHLTMLRVLDIGYCANLRSFSERLQHLTALQNLKIESCHPDLKNRFEDEEGGDWHCISHIPNIYIDGQHYDQKNTPFQHLIRLVERHTASLEGRKYYR